MVKTVPQQATKKFTYVRRCEVNRMNSQLDSLRDYAGANRWQRASITRGLYSQVREMVNEYGRDNTIKRLDFAIRNDKLRPRDMTMFDFAAMPDLLSVGGRFSTFDSKLAKMVRDKKSHEEIAQYIGLVRNYYVSDNYAELVSKFCDENPTLRKNAMRSGWNGDVKPWWDFFAALCQYLITELFAEIGNYETPDKISLTLWICDSWPESVAKATIDGGQNSGGIYVNNMKFYKDGKKYAEPWIGLNRAVILRWIKEHNKQKFFNKMCNSFCHEFMHFIDNRFPNLGMLGEQKSYACVGNPSVFGDKNPHEATAWMVGNRIERMLQYKYSR